MALNLLLQAARLLDPLPFDKVYVGAAVLPLYLDASTRPDQLRPTDDVDVAIDVMACATPYAGTCRTTIPQTVWSG